MSGRLEVVVERTVLAPPDLVFDLYTDPARLPLWQPGLRRVVEQTGPLDVPGTRYALDQPGPRLRCEVVRVEPSHRHEQRETFRFYGWTGTATPEAGPGGGTRFRYVAVPLSRPRWFWRLVLAISVATFGRVEFDRLKRVAEDIAARA